MSTSTSLAAYRSEDPAEIVGLIKEGIAAMPSPSGFRNGTKVRMLRVEIHEDDVKALMLPEYDELADYEVVSDYVALYGSEGITRDIRLEK